MLTEVAPGIDVKRDILDRMGFEPVISRELRCMDERIFIPGRMGGFGKFNEEEAERCRTL